MENGYLLLLGVASLFVGGIDLLHTLAYKGVALFPGFDADLPTQLWIVSRSLQALTLLVAPFFFTRKVRPVPALVLYSLVTGGLLLSIFVWRVFPACYIEGRGLTPFKIGAEYAISLVLLASFLLLLRRGSGLEPGVRNLLGLFIACTIGAELAFTFYVSVFGFSNMAGHLLKIIAYTFLYRALVVTGLKKPYALLLRDLKRSEEAFHRERDLAESLIEAAPVIIALLDREGKIVRYNPAMEALCGVPSAKASGLDWFQTFVPALEQPARRERFARVLREGKGGGEVNSLLGPRGEEVRLQMFLRRLPAPEAGGAGMLVVGLDVTEQVRRGRQEEREALICRLEAALVQVKALSGLLPICASCKRVRDDQGYWKQIEGYLRQHSEATISHGICPECAAKVAEKLEKLQEKKGEPNR
jgi:PAS domain S-box-containing protein